MLKNHQMKKLVLLLLIVLFAVNANAQRWKLKRYRLYIGVASANYFGDIGGAATESNWFGIKDLDFNMSRPAYHIGVLYKIDKFIDVKINFNYGTLSGTDERSKLENRGLEFRSTILEPSLQVNYIFYSSDKGGGSGRIFSRKGMLNNYSKINYYVFGGFGAAWATPHISEELMQERQSTVGMNEFNTNNNVTLVTPLGLGAFFILNSSWEIGLELGGRITLTDYVDGFSSKWSNSKDIYYLTSLTAIYRIKTKRNGWPQFEFFRQY